MLRRAAAYPSALRINTMRAEKLFSEILSCAAKLRGSLLNRKTDAMAIQYAAAAAAWPAKDVCIAHFLSSATRRALLLTRRMSHGKKFAAPRRAATAIASKMMRDRTRENKLVREIKKKFWTTCEKTCEFSSSEIISLSFDELLLFTC